MKTFWLAILVCALWPMGAAADEVFPDVQYLSGHAGMDKKVKGSLTLTDRELTFTAKDGPGSFTVPLADVTDATNSVEQNPGSTGAKLMLGVFASKKEEFLYVNTESKDGAEALVFKTKNKTSPAMVAKIKFQVKKSAATVHADAASPNLPAPSDSVTAISTPPDSASTPK